MRGNPQMIQRPRAGLYISSVSGPRVSCCQGTQNLEQHHCLQTDSKCWIYIFAAGLSTFSATFLFYLSCWFLIFFKMPFRSPPEILARLSSGFYWTFRWQKAQSGNQQESCLTHNEPCILLRCLVGGIAFWPTEATSGGESVFFPSFFCLICNGFLPEWLLNKQNGDSWEKPFYCSSGDSEDCQTHFTHHSLSYLLWKYFSIASSLH